LTAVNPITSSWYDTPTNPVSRRRDATPLPLPVELAAVQVPRVAVPRRVVHDVVEKAFREAVHHVEAVPNELVDA